MPKKSNRVTSKDPLEAKLRITDANVQARTANVILALADKLDPASRDIDNPALGLLSGGNGKKEWTEPPDIVDWAQSNFVDPVANDYIQLMSHQQRLLRTILRMIWDKQVITVVWSDIKKSGKTTVAGLVGTYWGCFVEQPNEIITVANDQEQAQGRIYASMVPSLQRMGWNVPERLPVMDNGATGSKIRAIGTNYAGEAGANQGLTLWSELWAFVSENRKRLWEELTPVPTRRYSIRWVETYAGFLGESELLWNLYCQAFRDGNEDEPLGEQVSGLEDLPVWYIPHSKLFVYWNHVPKMPWQTEEYYAQQRADLRPLAFMRLHRNMWVSSSDQFISPTVWDALDICEPLKEDGDTRPIVLGVDASTSNDSTALVATTWDPTRKGPDIIGAWIWRPVQTEDIIDKNKIVDLNLLKEKISYLVDNYQVLAIYYDASQLHSIMTELKKSYDRLGLKKMFVNFPQSSGRIESDQAFYQFILTKQLRRIHHIGLREHVLNAVAEETPRGYRLAKEKTKNKIDAAVAASMATYGASVRSRPTRTFVKV